MELQIPKNMELLIVSTPSVIGTLTLKDNSLRPEEEGDMSGK